MSGRIEWTVVPAEHTRLGPTFDVVELHVETGSTGAIIARLHPSVRGVQGREETAGPLHRRAWVMAASEDLLAALSSLLSRFDVVGEDAEDSAVKKAVAALAKARGK